MLRREDLQTLAVARLTEAISLFENAHYSGAYYLGGYAIELSLKAFIANSFQSGTIPDRKHVESIYTHDLAKLVEVAGLKLERLARAKNDAAFARHWEYVAEWTESARYTIVDEEKAHTLIDALRDPDHGVFEWIKTHW